MAGWPKKTTAHSIIIKNKSVVEEYKLWMNDCLMTPQHKNYIEKLLNNYFSSCFLYTYLVLGVQKKGYVYKKQDEK